MFFQSTDFLKEIIQFIVVRIQVKPIPVKNPKVVTYSADALKLLDIDEEITKVRTFQGRIFEISNGFSCCLG